MIFIDKVFAEDVLDKVVKPAGDYIVKEEWSKIVGAENSMIQNTIVLAVQLAIALAVTFLIYGGIQYLLAAGDEAKAWKATKIIVNALIGLVVALIAAFLIIFARQGAEFFTK